MNGLKAYSVLAIVIVLQGLAPEHASAQTVTPDTLAAQARAAWDDADKVAIALVWKDSASPQCLQIKSMVYSVVIPQLDQQTDYIYHINKPDILKEMSARMEANRQGSLIQIQQLVNQATATDCLVH